MGKKKDKHKSAEPTLLTKFAMESRLGITQLAEVEVFEKADYHGESFRTNLGWTFPQDNFWNDCISSIVVISGRWRFCVKNNGSPDEGYVDKGPGRYANETQIGLPNDSISSFYPLSDG